MWKELLIHSNIWQLGHPIAKKSIPSSKDFHILLCSIITERYKTSTHNNQISEFFPIPLWQPQAPGQQLAENLWSLYCSASRLVGQDLQQGQKRCLFFPFFPCKFPVVYSPESTSRLGNCGSQSPQGVISVDSWETQFLGKNHYGFFLLFIFRKSSVLRIVSKTYFSSIQVAKLYWGKKTEITYLSIFPHWLVLVASSPLFKSFA